MTTAFTRDDYREIRDNAFEPLEEQIDNMEDYDPSRESPYDLVYDHITHWWPEVFGPYTTESVLDVLTEENPKIIEEVTRDDDTVRETIIDVPKRAVALAIARDFADYLGVDTVRTNRPL